MYVGMIANPRKLRREYNTPPAIRTLENILVDCVKDLAPDLAKIVPEDDLPQFASYFKRYARQVAYDYVELQKHKAVPRKPKPTDQQSSARTADG